MRKKKLKTLFSFLICVCMILVGLNSMPTYAAETNLDQPAVTEQTQEDDTENVEQAETPSENESNTTQEAEKDTSNEGSSEIKQEQKKKEAKSQATPKTSGTAKVSAVKLTDEDGSVWGKGLITGSEDLDDKSWDRTTGENRGFDNSSSNDIIRSFDSINYNVSSTINMDGQAHTLVYEITLPDDPEISLDTNSMNAKEVTKNKNSDNTITYFCKYELQKGYAGGEKEENIVVKVGNKHQGDTIRPTIKAYLDDDSDAALTVENMETVTVTTGPMYNIVLAKKSGETITRDIYDFSDSEFKENAKDYTDYKVNGYKCTFGFALELRKPGSGIKGVELPKSDEDFTFDIDLSQVTLNGKNLAEEGFTPLLYYLGNNIPGGEAVVDLPFTEKLNNNETRGCYDSGKVKMVQEGTTLHVTVKDFDIDSTQFPKENYAKKSYWEDLNKIREGIFSSFRLQVVYPYINENGDDLKTKLGDGSINATVEAKNMSAISETETKTTTETSLDDNTQSNTWQLLSGSKRNQQVFYSDRKNMINPYSVGAIWTDEDIAAVGADDLAFSVTYSEGNLGEAYAVNDMPIAIDQFVLFDRSAIEDVEYSNYWQGKQNGYSCSVRYAVSKKGRLDNDSMRTATLDDFDFYDTKPEGGCDAVLVQYRGANLGASELNLRAQFTAKVKDDAKVADHVYMVTAFTNTWTVSDFKDDILKATGKSSLSDVTREDLSTWGKSKGSVKEAAKLVEDKKPTLPTIDYRNIYTVPDYVNGVYTIDSNHKSSINYADALYIVPYTTTVTKTVAQLDDNNNPRQRYDIGKGQNYVDYRISNSIKYWGNVKVPENATTTVYLTDTLPEGLTYVEGSASWGGKYTSRYPQVGKVTGGTKIEPEITTVDGQTVLKWTIPDVKLENGEIPSLYYSCKIDKDVNNNANLKNTVTIQTDEDKRAIYKENDNISTAGISVTRSKEFYIVKHGGDSLELQGNSYYELIAANSSSEDKKDLCIFDTMPYANDGKSTQMKGKYKINALTMNAADVNHASDMEIWYTDSSKYIGKTAKDISASEVAEENGWKKATAKGFDTDTITFEGEGLIGDWPTVIAYKDANLERNTIATLRLDYEAVAGAENDDFVNSWTTMSNKQELRSDAETDIYKRTLEGTVWFDKDQDGKIDEGEDKLEGVKVTLYVNDGNGNYIPYTPYNETVDGNTYVSPSTTYTDENGHYEFTGLPAGDYRVVFESSDGTKLGHYDVTKANADKDKTITSKVEESTKDENGELTSGTITDIKMPALKEMGDKVYNLPDQNLGLIIPTIEVSGTKVWNDANNQDGKRPDTIKLNLYADGVKVKDKEAKIIKNDDNTWSWTFANLPKYSEKNLKDLQEIKYTVDEDSVPEYTTEISGNTITNTHTPEFTSVKGTKTWKDADNQDGKRPESITVRLFADGKEVTNKEVKAADNWSYSFDNLPKYSAGKKVIYTVSEDAVEGYTTEVNGYDIINTHAPELTSVKGTKTWKDADDQDGKRPESITVRLLADGKEVSNKEVKAADNWSYSFENLPKYSAGKKIVYTVSEDTVEGYTTEINGYDIINTHTPELTSVKGTKTWKDADDQDGKRPESITVRLLADGKEVSNKEVKAADNWSYSFENLPKYSAGKKVIYTVSEDAVEGYTTEVNGYDIINSYTPGKVSISITKSWDDSNDKDGIRPNSIKASLYADGKDTGKTLILTKDDNWSGLFTDLDEYQEGKKISYTIKEENVDGYKSTITGDMVKGYIITNTHTPKHITDHPSEPNSPNGGNGTTETKKDNSVKTGDNTSITEWLISFITAGLSLILLGNKRKKSVE